ncbi:hypothetical protein GM415_08575 [Pseudodesulfovibrio cashew]|uniref:AMP nucleosidase n=1 Tax=Pseudodesulfovibrio cashew TaxID=2678688 RepID=A0A6I6JGP2_9BACT|nr:LOG family protein [Pseudodesulfovibrio cashew]QGY40180.1 hypothetical protein GM415_08575 [Pseudodesulfovibrio cashew]
MTWDQFEYHDKPCWLLDVKGYYTCLAEHMDRMFLNGFLVQEHRRMVLTDADPASLLDQFDNYVPPEVDKWIEKKKGL